MPTEAGTSPTPARGPSAVYTTGQLAWTLLRTGLPRDHPALVKAWRYLLAQQQDFGGWFQTTTHENFRTPMRETRYAVMALAEAFPRKEAPLRGWGNRATGPGAAAAIRLAREHARRSGEPLGCARGRPCTIRPSDRQAARTPRAASARRGRSRAGPAGAGRVSRAAGGAARRPLQDRLAHGRLGAAQARKRRQGRRSDQASARRRRSPRSPRGHSRFRLSILRNG